jgi:hypothetical protein
MGEMVGSVCQTESEIRRWCYLGTLPKEEGEQEEDESSEDEEDEIFEEYSGGGVGGNGVPLSEL